MKAFAQDVCSIYRRYGFLPDQVSISGERDFVLAIDNPDNFILKSKVVESVNRHKVPLAQALKTVEQCRKLIRRTQAPYVKPRGNPFDLHDFSKMLESEYGDKLTRSANQHLQYEGRDLFTLLKERFSFLPIEFIRKTIRILGVNIKHRLSFAQMLFARVKNDKSPCSKPPLVLISSINHTNIIDNRMVLTIRLFTIILDIILIDNGRLVAKRFDSEDGFEPEPPDHLFKPPRKRLIERGAFLTRGNL